MTARRAGGKTSSRTGGSSSGPVVGSPTARRPSRRIFQFGNGRADGSASMKALLGGKGADLAERSRLGLPVPPGFTISTEVCGEYSERRGLPRAVKSDIDTALARVEVAVGKRFGEARNPLLLSVRSGARVSMPGMMDSVLNLGLNQSVVEALAVKVDARFAFDS